MSGDPGAYRKFLSRQQIQLEKRANHAIAWFVGLGVLLFVLLFWLGSGFWVGVYVVAVLFLVLSGALGFRRLRKSVYVTQEAVGHLEEIAELIEDEPSRDEVLDKLEELGTPQDRSNVPEALLHFVEGDRLEAEPENVARSAFSHARDALEHAGLLRNVLILGGLFGTVLFFAHELNAPQVAGGDISELLPGLKGALASTLAGIASSVGVGFYGSKVDVQLDTLVRETEAFLGGPVGRAARRRPERRPAEDETELWESLRAEVHQMTIETREAYEGLAEDVRVHTDTLRELGDQLADAPPIEVPEELENLEASVEEFSGSARLLGELVPPLLETVAAMEIFAPARVVEGVDDIQERQQELGGKITQDLDRTREEVQQARDQARSAADSVEGIPEKIERGLAELDEEASSLKVRLERIQSAVEEEQRARREAYKEMRGKVGRTHEEIEEIREKAFSLPGEIRESVTRLESAANELEPLASRLDEAGESLVTRSRGDGATSPTSDSEIVELAKEVKYLRRRVENISRWVDEARSAPLMKLLTWPGFS